MKDEADEPEVMFTVVHEDGREEEVPSSQLDAGFVLKGGDGSSKLTLEATTFETLPEGERFRDPVTRTWYAKMFVRSTNLAKPLKGNKPFGKILADRRSEYFRPSQAVEKLVLVPVKAKAA